MNGINDNLDTLCSASFDFMHRNSVLRVHANWEACVPRFLKREYTTSFVSSA